MKILVTGAGGFLGVHVLERLIAHGCLDIRCFLRDPAKAPAVGKIAAKYPDARLELMYGNLRSKADCARAVNAVSTVYHLAAGLKGSPAELFADSVVASRCLLESLESRNEPPIKKTRVVLVSSFGVYGVASLRRGARIDEQTPLERLPEKRDTYSHAKLWQEQMFWRHQHQSGFELVVLRPGVIYGPGGGAFSNRVGLQIGSTFFHLGGRNLLPLSFVVNCAEAIVFAGTHPSSAGEAYNVHDDDLLTASQYLRQYRKKVRNVRSIHLPYFATHTLAWLLEKYHDHSHGQLPPVITRYKVASMWGGNRFDNGKLRGLGWRQLVDTPDALAQTLQDMRRRQEVAPPRTTDVAHMKTATNA